MSIELYLVFVAATALLIATPGPNVALIVGTSLTHGARTGLIAVAGVNIGVPVIVPVRVSVASSTARANPKSVSITRSTFASNRIFAGLMSR